MQWKSSWLRQLEKRKKAEEKDGKSEIWFAWYPVQLNNGKVVWLEKVKRMSCVYFYRDGYDIEYVYREVN